MQISKLRSTRFEPNGDWIPVAIAAVLISVVGLLALLSYIAIRTAAEGDSQKKRADTLQTSLDALRNRSEEDRRFFDTVRQVIVAQSEEDRQRLIDELRNFQFSTDTGSVSSTRRSGASTTTTTPSSSPTSTTSTTGVSSTTTTTTRPTSSTTSSTTVCVTNPILPVPVCR